MELDVAAKVHSGTIKDSTLCGMSRDDFYRAMVSVVFPGFTTFCAKDKCINKDLEFSPDDVASMLYSARMSGVKRTYYIGNGLGDPIPIPEFMEDDQYFMDATEWIEGVTFRPFSKHPLYVKAECLAKIIRVVDQFTQLAACHMYRPHAVIDAFASWLKYETELFSDLAVTVVKWLTAWLPIENRNVFVDYLAKEECYYGLYVELVRFIHEYLTEQDNIAKFEL